MKLLIHFKGRKFARTYFTKIKGIKIYFKLIGKESLGYVPRGLVQVVK